jgi:hypothetical protein
MRDGPQLFVLSKRPKVFLIITDDIYELVAHWIPHWMLGGSLLGGSRPFFSKVPLHFTDIYIVLALSPARKRHALYILFFPGIRAAPLWPEGAALPFY